MGRSPVLANPQQHWQPPPEPSYCPSPSSVQQWQLACCQSCTLCEARQALLIALVLMYASPAEILLLNSRCGMGWQSLCGLLLGQQGSQHAQLHRGLQPRAQQCHLAWQLGGAALLRTWNELSVRACRRRHTQRRWPVGLMAGIPVLSAKSFKAKEGTLVVAGAKP